MTEYLVKQKCESIYLFKVNARCKSAIISEYFFG